MKVNEPKQPTPFIQSTAGLQETAAGLAVAAAQPPVNTPDRVTMEDADHLRDSVTRGRRMAAGDRALRLQSLAQEVRSGAFRPDVSRLAAEILEQAELDARLAQSLG